MIQLHVTQSPKKRKKPWITDDLIKKVDIKEKAYKTWKNNKNNFVS